MRYILLALALSNSLAMAAGFKLNDPSILGEYRLSRANKKSELQVAQIRYNVDNKLVVMVDRLDQEFELSGPDKNGVIYEGEDDPNCGSGDEPSCMFDANTKIRLVSAKVGGEWIPQLIVEVTEVDAYVDGDAGTDYKWVLNWSRSIPDAIPYYISAEVPKEFARIIESCKKELKDESSVNEMDVCSFTRAYTYRGSETRAVNKYIKDNARKDRKMKQISEKTLTGKIFAGVNAWINGLDQRDLKMKKSEILAQSKKIQNFIVENCDKIYFEQGYNDANLLCVNTEEARITHISLRNKM